MTQKKKKKEGGRREERKKKEKKKEKGNCYMAISLLPSSVRDYMAVHISLNTLQFYTLHAIML